MTYKSADSGHATDTPTVPKHAKTGAPSHPGMMGDGTQEQNLNQHGDPAARITEDDVNAAFSKAKPKD